MLPSSTCADVRRVAVLQLFLSAPKSTLKFAAIRTLAQLAQTNPTAVQTCNLDMEKLINDDNRSVATFAITTLLKTGNEASVDRLMKQISAFMSEISDEFKVIVVNAIRALCLKFPSKQSVMLTFLSGVLRDEGGYDFKRAVVEAIFDMIKFIGDSKEAGTSPCTSRRTSLTVLLDSSRSTLRIHRGLRVHQALRQDPPPPRCRRAQGTAAVQVHSIHLQPCRPGECHRQGCGSLESRQIRCQRRRPGSQEQYQGSADEVSVELLSQGERELTDGTGAWTTSTTRSEIALPSTSS